MAKKKTIKLNNTTLFILIAIAVILALVVALAFSPVGTGLIDSLLEGSQNGENGSTKRLVQLGSTITDSNQNVVLENVVCQVHFINVLQGDAILVQLNDGTDVLIDGGSTSTGLAEIRTDFVDYLKGANLTGAIDYMIVTHPDTDHYNMLTAVMDEFVVENVIYNNCTKNQTYNEFIARVGEEVNGTHNVKIDADGEIYNDIIVGANYNFDIYAPGYDRFQDENADYDAYESNGMSPIITLEVQGKKMIFTGDATYETEEWFISTIGSTTLDYDILKVGHHGSDSSTTQAFLDKINVEYAIISSDDGTKHGHPTPIVMNRLFDEGIVTYLTHRQGNIVLSVDQNGNFAFEVENEVPVANNKNGINDKMIITEAGE